ncbi:serine/threonine-protein kinase HipA [Methylohalomonas lacus]|uniref:Serine/threonine-protein kinase HipA n=1 Tax=Methylohalomonas lacus TaxID=398773 RepID=A0AAE3HNP0_9GAMM|nr:type II toxin-antitoxin system HipA family toxin [Methylohalomonas lacus]MCS3904514.1 serine/threonine-protein kinase HipA [Methylohalomonas lacus]
MARPATQRRLGIWMNGEHVGDWDTGRHGQQSFRYAADWLDSPAVRPLSLSMPVQAPDQVYTDERVENFFDNLLPDSIDIRRRIQQRFSAASTRPFDLLAELGRDCVGAIQLLPGDTEPGDLRTITGQRLSDSDVADRLRRVPMTPLPGQADDEFRISIAGAQEKTALLWHDGAWHQPEGPTPSTHIFKLPLGRVGDMQADLSTSVENEWLCHQILAAYGLPVAECEMATFEDQKALISRRFDRKLAGTGDWWLRLPQEDLCQALAVSPDQKYERDGGPGIPTIMDLLLGAHEPIANRELFFKSQILFWMLAAMDGHAKNFSVYIEPQGRYRLTPFYDILSALPVIGQGTSLIAPQKVRMAMAMTGRNRHYEWDKIQRRHIVETGHRSGLDVEPIINKVIEQTPEVVETVRSKLPAQFPEQVSRPVLSGLLEKSTRLKS